MTALHATPGRFSATWRRVHTGAGALSPEAVHRDVVARYAAPARRYHTLGHVDECLARLDDVADLVGDPDAIEIAIWFHDVVCEPGVRDNEARSARYYLERSAGASSAFRRAVCRMILASSHVKPAMRADPGYMVDIDLAGFGRPWEEFRSTTDLIRAEFPQRSEREFAAGLAPFLRSLVGRPRIFATDWFRDRCEATARHNVALLLDEWDRAGYLAAGAPARSA
jgi:predicted metal-dependent HD superfamily phosphohydrolase